jgi:hypothetical protein
MQASVDPETSSVAHGSGGADVLAPIVRCSMFWIPHRFPRPFVLLCGDKAYS